MLVRVTMTGLAASAIVCPRVFSRAGRGARARAVGGARPPLAAGAGAARTRSYHLRLFVFRISLLSRLNRDRHFTETSNTSNLFATVTVGENGAQPLFQYEYLHANPPHGFKVNV